MSTPEDRIEDDDAQPAGEGSLTSLDGSVVDGEAAPGAGPGGEGSLTNAEDDED